MEEELEQLVVQLGGGQKLYEGYPEWREKQVMIHVLGKGVQKIINDSVYDNCMFIIIAFIYSGMMLDGRFHDGKRCSLEALGRKKGMCWFLDFRHLE